MKRKIKSWIALDQNGKPFYHPDDLTYSITKKKEDAEEIRTFICERGSMIVPCTVIYEVPKKGRKP